MQRHLAALLPMCRHHMRYCSPTVNIGSLFTRPSTHPGHGAPISINLSNRACSSSTAATTNLQAVDAMSEKLYTDASYFPTYVGPVEPRYVEGKGRGLFATQPISPGQLLLLCQPIACIHGPADSMPPPTDLLDLMKDKARSRSGSSRLTPDQAMWLNLLYDGRSRTPEQWKDDARRLAKLLQQQQQQQGSTGGNPDPSAAASADLDPDLDLEMLVSYNAFGDQFEDLAVADCRAGSSTSGTGNSSDSSSSAQSHVGLWPAFSLLNHSCLPSCVHYVVGRSMVVRAVREVAAGEELSVSYLGREDFSPATTRNALLQQRYGFSCTCNRCRLEAGLAPGARALLEDLHSAVQHSLAPRLTEAAVADDQASLVQVHSELQRWAKDLYPLMTSQQQQAETAAAAAASAGTVAAEGRGGDGGNDRRVMWLGAAAYGYLELVYMADSLLPDQDPSPSLGLLGQVVGEVSGGSELHAFMTARKFMAGLGLPESERAEGPGQEAFLAAAAECQAAHRQRYGHVSNGLLGRLMKRNAHWAEQFM